MPTLCRCAVPPAFTRLATALTACLCLALASPEPVHAGRPGVWTAPLDTMPLEVIREFDPPAVRWLAGHRGVDLASAAGATVRTAGSGIVTYAGLVAGRGVVAIGHGELRTTYEPVAASVVAGQVVDAGQPIGVLTAVANHCLPAVCLHWGALRADTYLDPLLLLVASPVRLLPLGEAALAVPNAGSPAGSGAGVSPFVRTAQPLDRHVRVDLRRRE